MREVPKQFSQKTPHGDYVKHTNPRTGDEIYTLDEYKRRAKGNRIIEVHNPKTGEKETRLVPPEKLEKIPTGYAILPREISVRANGKSFPRGGDTRGGGKGASIDHNLSGTPNDVN